jgi:hypothetical protein
MYLSQNAKELNYVLYHMRIKEKDDVIIWIMWVDSQNDKQKKSKTENWKEKMKLLLGMGTGLCGPALA